MTLLMDVGYFGLGLAVVIASAEQLVDRTIGVSRRLGVSAFLIGVLGIGFDAENLAVGLAAGSEAAAGIALGTIVGSAMVALALAFGLTALVVPLEFGRVPRRVLCLPLAAVALLTGLAVDGTLSRLDGALLLGAYGVATGLLIRWERHGLHVLPTGAVEDEAPDEARPPVAGVLFVLALIGVVVGSELLLRGARPLIAALGWTDTLFGMTVLALLVSVEEVARELPAALRGRPDVSFGNVVGSALAFFCFNAGAIALLRPVAVGPVTRTFYLPVCAGTMLLIAGLMAFRRVPRWGGALLLALYALFVGAPFV
ncbi:MAG: sodium:calcium antiporter [Salinibacter sp.]